MKYVVSLLAASLMMCVAITQSRAQAITYTEQASVDGSLGGNTLTSADVILTFTGDLSNVMAGSPGLYPQAGGTTTIDVVGIGLGTITDPVTVGLDQFMQYVTFVDDGAPVLSTTNGTFAGYGLSTDIGPVTGTPRGTAGTWGTSLGNFTIIDESDTTFTATIGGPAPTPEPSAFAMLAASGIVLGGFVRRRKRA